MNGGYPVTPFGPMVAERLPGPGPFMTDIPPARPASDEEAGEEAGDD